VSLVVATFNDRRNNASAFRLLRQKFNGSKIINRNNVGFEFFIKFIEYKNNFQNLGSRIFRKL